MDELKPAVNGHNAHASQTVAIGNNPILADAARAHEGLVAIRTAVAQAKLQMHPNLTGFNHMPMAISIMSAGPDVADQMIVFSPGGEAQRTAKTLIHRMRQATQQLEMLLENGAFDG